MTPIERLHDAVQSFVNEVDGEDNGIVTAFVLGYERTRLTDEPGIEARVTSTDYATGPGTTLSTAIGLNAILGRYLDEVLDMGE